MPLQQLTFYCLAEQLDEELTLSECLFFPESSALTSAEKNASRELTRQIEHILSESPPIHWFRRREPGTDLTTQRFTVTLDPPRQDARWLTPVELHFDAVLWSHGKQLELAYVPLLGIEVFGNSIEELHERIPNQILFALRRQRLTTSLGPLLEAGRRSGLEVTPLRIEITIPTPKEIETAEGEPERSSILDEVTTRWDERKLPPAFEREAEVARLVEVLTGSRPRSVLLVGPSGVGKTNLVQELVRSRRQRGLSQLTVRSTGGARLVAGASGFGMWQERCMKLCKEANPDKILLHLGNLVELTEAGRGGASGQGIASFLASRIDSGEIRVIVECTPQQKEAIQRRDPGLLAVFQEVVVKEPDEETGRSILLDYANWMVPGDESPLTLEAVMKLDRLHRRYATYSVYPGRPLRFLRNILEDRDPETILSASDITQAFSRETGLPTELLDESVTLDLDRIRDWFAKRVIGQPEAVSLIVDLLAAVKAGLTQPGKPIASLLFIGPTGVGKTEMAKSIAEYFFGDPQRMIRIDMSEYADPLAADRLIGGRSGEGVITGPVRDQPFGVVLFDEFEKAHPVCFDMLLQVLGEGRLTDASGQLADFRNCLVIMTSNLGVESASRSGVGFVDPKATASNLAQHFIDEVRQSVRPEFFNRIDRVIPFGALTADVLKDICERELGLIQKRDGLLYRGVPLNLDEAVIDHLVEVGSDTRYGARPLKRAIERELLIPIANGVNSYQEATPLAASAVMSDGELDVKVAPLDSKEWKTAARMGVDASASSIQSVHQVLGLRRWVWKVRNGANQIEVRSELFRLLDRQQKRIKNNLPPEASEGARLAFLHRYLDRFDRYSEDVLTLEELMLFEIYQRTVDVPANMAEEVSRLDAEKKRLLLLSYASLLEDYESQSMWLIMFGQRGSLFHDMLEAYLSLAEQEEYRTRFLSLHPFRGEPRAKQPEGHRILGLPAEEEAVVDPGSLVLAKSCRDLKELRTRLQQGVGVAIRFTGFLAWARFEPERGRHVWKADRSQEVLVETTTDIKGWEPPPGINRSGSFDEAPLRRTWRTNRSTVLDATLAPRAATRFEPEAVSKRIQELNEELLQRTADGEVV